MDTLPQKQERCGRETEDDRPAGTERGVSARVQEVEEELGGESKEGGMAQE